MADEANERIWREYIGNLVRVFDRYNSLIIYGVPISTDERLTRFLPYTSFRGLNSEDLIYEWINDGLPRSIRTETIFSMEVVPKSYVDSNIEVGKRKTQIAEMERRWKELSYGLELPKMEKQLKREQEDH